MPREIKFAFLPVRNEDLRRAKEEKKFKPYVRIQKPGILIFPQKTLEHFEIKKGDLSYMRFYLDAPKRALAFKFIDKSKAEEFKEFRPLSITTINDYTQGAISIKSILNQFGSWPMPVKCELGTYNGQDDYIHFGKLNYIIIPKGKKEQETSNE